MSPMRRFTPIFLNFRNVKKRKVNKHMCELARGSDCYLPKLPPNAKYCARLKRGFQKLILVSAKNPVTPQSFRSHTAIAFEKKKHGRSPNWWVIHPCSQFRFVWDLIMSITYSYSFVAIPYILAFHLMASEKYTPQESSLIPVYAICIVDIILNFLTGFSLSNSHEIFIDPVLIVRHYAKGFFLVDLLSSIPYSWILQKYHNLPGKTSNFPTIVFELIPLIKLFRLGTLKQYLKKISMGCGMSEAPTIIIWLFLQTCFICHWSACLSFGFPIIALHAKRTDINDAKESLWLEKFKMYESSDAIRYLMSLHAGICNLWGSTFQDNDSEGSMIARSLILIFGASYQVYLIVVVLQLMASRTAPETKYQQLMNELQEFMHEKRLPKALQTRLLEYYEYRFQGRYFKENVITSTLPDHMKQEILMHSCRGVLENVMIFSNVSRTLTLNIIATLKPDIYLRNDVIFKCETQGDCMYFIASGTVAVITFKGKEVCHLEDGGFFGESVLVRADNRRMVTVIAVETSELYRFDRRDFKKLVPPESELFTRIVKIAEARTKIVAQFEKHDKTNLKEGESITRTEQNKSETDIHDDKKAEAT